MADPRFHHFISEELQGVQIPEKFTFPFSYEPHTLSEVAAQHLIKEIEQSKAVEGEYGKMYGVLVVQNQQKELGYLYAFSGQQENFGGKISFVPSIHDRMQSDEFFKKGEKELNKLNQSIKKIEKDPAYKSLQKELENIKKKAAAEIEEKRSQKQEKKSKRKEIREEAKKTLSKENFEKKNKQLDQESIDIHYDYKKLNEEWNKRVGKVQSKLAQFENKIASLKKARKKKSNQLQQKLFDQYQFLNAKGQKRSMQNVFQEMGSPPAGAGDCSAPKLLQYAYANQYQPIAMAEFWWGNSPKSQLRTEGKYYPACAGKCKPILGHMLEGLDVEEDPMLSYRAEEYEVKLIFEDDHIAIVNKPAGLLTIPSKLIDDALASRMKKWYPNASGPLVAHRLDKLTSGLMIITKSLEDYKIVQQQFIDKTIEKEYSALLNGRVQQKEGRIELPLTVDEFNRPMQMVSFEKGKKAITEYEVLKEKANRTLVKFKPITGRTHQLRVHAAHPQGLNAPIVGDTLYGKKNKRLMLHAAKITFDHPQTKERLTFYEAAEFES